VPADYDAVGDRQTLRIIGANFIAVQEVTVDQAPVESFRVLSNNEIEVVVRGQAFGFVKVRAYGTAIGTVEVQGTELTSTCPTPIQSSPPILTNPIQSRTVTPLFQEMVELETSQVSNAVNRAVFFSPLSDRSTFSVETSDTNSVKAVVQAGANDNDNSSARLLLQTQWFVVKEQVITFTLTARNSVGSAVQRFALRRVPNIPARLAVVNGFTQHVLVRRGSSQTVSLELPRTEHLWRSVFYDPQGERVTYRVDVDNAPHLIATVETPAAGRTVIRLTTDENANRAADIRCVITATNRSGHTAQAILPVAIVE
jgi:hypothetical protein